MERSNKAHITQKSYMRCRVIWALLLNGATKMVILLLLRWLIILL